jgi:hypothetical protein
MDSRRGKRCMADESPRFRSIISRNEELTPIDEEITPTLLRDLAPVLPKELLSQAVEIALKIPDDTERYNVLLVLAVHFSEGKRKNILHYVDTVGFYIPEVDGICLANGDFMKIVPNGLSLSTMAGMTYSSGNTVLVGISIQYYNSDKFLEDDGGWRRVVWMSKELKERVKAGIDEDMMTKIATEDDAKDIPSLKAFMLRVDHPIVEGVISPIDGKRITNGWTLGEETELEEFSEDFKKTSAYLPRTDSMNAEARERALHLVEIFQEKKLGKKRKKGITRGLKRVAGEVDQPTKHPEAKRDESIREAMLQLQKRSVSSGFASEDKPDTSLDSTTPLETGKSYYFWLEVGVPVVGSFGNVDVTLPDGLPIGAKLKVVLFSFKDEIQIKAGSDIGKLQLKSDGTAQVIDKKPALPPNIPTDVLNRRLFFPVTAPRKAGTYKLRCSIYYNEILIQSYLISSHVMETPEPTSQALRLEVDYVLSSTLQPSRMIGLESHRLSILLNSNGDGNHNLTFWGANGEELFKSEATISVLDLMNLIKNTRNALRKVSWDNELEWNKGMVYKYQDKKFNLDRLKKDLITLAKRGFDLYDGIIGQLTDERADELAKLMINSGLVQISLRRSATEYIPAALLYDYPIDTKKDLRLCEAFERSLQENTPLEDTQCFKGNCPSKGKNDYVCPSGFWGYRHGLGFPISLKVGMDVPPRIFLTGEPQIMVGAASNLKLLNGHMKNLKDKLKEIRKDLDWHYSEDRDTILELLKNEKSHLIYFYCHGGAYENSEAAFIQVGTGLDKTSNKDDIVKSTLRGWGVHWDCDPHPLIFINGCETTALRPGQIMNLVQGFVEAHGAGVIGTEITVFEELASDFAEVCLSRFMLGVPIGEAVRWARLRLLKEGNPLGLVYIPFVLPSIKLVDQQVLES